MYLLQIVSEFSFASLGIKWSVPSLKLIIYMSLDIEAYIISGSWSWIVG